MEETDQHKPLDHHNLKGITDLMKESQDHVFHKRWKLYAPLSLKGLIDKGIGDFDAIG